MEDRSQDAVGCKENVIVERETFCDGAGDLSGAHSVMRPGLSVTETSVDARNAEEEDATKDTDVTPSQKRGSDEHLGRAGCRNILGANM